jgi:hypothetical protein
MPQSHAARLQPQESGFIGELKQFADSIVDGSQKISYYTHLIEASPTLQALCAKEPHFKEAVEGAFDQHRMVGGFNEGSIISNEGESVKEKYRLLLDAVFALLEISQGGLGIDNYPTWENCQTAWKKREEQFDIRFKQWFPENMTHAKSYIDNWTPDITKDLGRKDNIDLVLLDGTGMANGEYFLSRDIYDEQGHIDAAKAKQLIHSPSYIDDFQKSEIYKKYRLDALYIDDFSNQMIGGGSYARGVRQLESKQVQALLDYAQTAEGDAVVPEITAFVRQHRMDIELLKQVLVSAEEASNKSTKNDPPVKGSPADWFAAAKTKQV